MSSANKLRSRKRSKIVLCCCAGEDGEVVEKVDDEFQPPPSRNCTDVVYLGIFIVFCFIMILIAAFAYVYGNPYRLINGMDSFGNICGTVNEPFGDLTFSGMDMTGKQYVLYFDLQNMEQTTKICVEKCPTNDLRSLSDIKKFYEETGVNLCRYDYDFDLIRPKKNGSDHIFKFLKSEPSLNLSNILCPKLPFYSSLPVLRRCIPKPTAALKNRLFFNIYAYLNSLDIWKQILGDLATTWVTVLVLTIISFVISFGLVILIHWITSFVSQIIMVASSVLTIGFSIFLWWTYIDIKRTIDGIPEERRLEEHVKNETAFLTYSILSSLFTVVLTLVTLVLRKRVTVVVQLFREAAKALCAMPCLVIQPFVTYIALTGFFCLWLYVILCLATADVPTKKDASFPSVLNPTVSDDDLEGAGEQRSLDSSPATANNTVNWNGFAGISVIEYRDGAWIKYMWWIHVIGLIWISEFILACQQMVVASSVATWYFSRNRKALRCIIAKSVVQLVKYHVGSVALGSALITLIKIPRLMLSFSDRVMRNWEDNWSWIKWLRRGCACCLTCFENCIKYIHHNAYTVISIQGVDFFPASRLAFSALVQNALQVAVINSTGDFVLFLAKCITAALTGVIALIIFQTNETLYFYAIPVLLTVVFSYFVAHSVISVFEMAVDTLFLCFCEDHNMNDGTDGKEFYAPSSLLKFMTEDAVDAVTPGRRPRYSSSEKKSVKGIELAVVSDEMSPINVAEDTVS